MKKRSFSHVCISLVLGLAAVSAAGEVPFSAIRLRKPHTDRPEVWKATLEEFRKYREGVDEVWFSTGICFPKMDEHRAAAKRLAAAADELRAIGILPSLQIQATLGHGDSLVHYADNSGLAWQRWVAENGHTAKAVNCMRAPGFVAYMTEMASLYAGAMRPYAVWIDDDIRCISHGGLGWGCHCEHCLDAFAKKEGKAYTRKELVKEMKADPALAARWRAFAFEGEAALVRAIGDAVHAASPETRMCIQQPGKCFPEHRALYEACHAATGLPVAMRPGAGSYYDHDPRDQIAKAYTLAIQMEKIGARVGPQSLFDRICPEIETCPRSFACRTGRGVLLEGLEALAQGMNGLSALAIDAGYETPAWYGGEILAPLARNAAMMKRYVAVSDGAERAGYVFAGGPTEALRTSSLPIRAMPAETGLGTGRPAGLARLVTSGQAESVIGEGKDAVAALLEEDLVLDGGAARALFDAGYGVEIGFAADEPKGYEDAFYSLRERFTDASVNAGLLAREAPIYGSAYVLRPAKDAVAVSEYYSDMNADAHPGVAAFIYETPKGRRRVVFGQGVFETAMRLASGDRVLQMHRLADWASHGRSPVLLETPTRSFVQPRVRVDGTLASVVFVNASIGETWPVRMRLRGVPSGVDRAVWSSFDADDVSMEIVRDGEDAIVTLPKVPAWTGGYVFFDPSLAGEATKSPNVEARNLAPLAKGAVPARPEAVKNWRDKRFGMFIHWGPVSLTGKEIGWSRGRQTPVEEYDSLYKRFNPEKFNADEWVAVAKAAGMKYIVLTTKHHDGFCLWDTKETDYNIMNTPFGRDVVKELSEACVRGGIRFGAYYSTCDWYHPDFPLTSPGGKTPRKTHDLDRYTDYMKAQVRELLVNYGPLICLWHDVAQKFDARRGAGVINMERAIQPDVLVNNRTGNPGDFDTPEQRIGKFQMDRPWETCMTICRQWSWKPNDSLKPLDRCLHALIRTIGGDGNFLFNVGPQPDGLIEPRQVTRLKEMGDWVKRHAAAIYETRGGPWKPSPDVASTRRGDRIYVFCMKKPSRPIVLQALPLAVKSARALGDGAVVRMSDENGQLALHIEDCAWDGIATVVELVVAGEAMSVEPLPACVRPTLTGATASASSVFGGDSTYAPNKAIDGDDTTRWATPSGTHTAWLRIDLGEERSVSGIHIEEECCGCSSRVKKWALQKLDGEKWTTVYSGERIGAHFEAQFEPVKARTVRIEVQDATEGPTFSEVWLLK